MSDTKPKSMPFLPLLLCALALAPLGGCERSCGEYEANMPALGGSIESTEECGSNLGSWLFDMGADLGGTWMNAEPRAFYGDLYGIPFEVYAVMPGLPLANEGYGIEAGDVYTWGESLAGGAHWSDENTAVMDDATLTSGTVEILEELAPDEFLEVRIFRVRWDLVWGDSTSEDAPWYAYSGEDKMTLAQPVWDETQRKLKRLSQHGS